MNTDHQDRLVGLRRRWVTANPKTLMATAAAARWLGRYSGRLSAIPGWTLWFTPWEVPVSERGLTKQAGWLATTEPVSFRTRWGRVAGFSAGEGPVVLLIHGWGERAATLGGFIAPLVERGYRVVGLDMPGHGASGRWRTNIIESANALAKVSERLGGTQALVAHSFGANVALWAMRHSGLNVERAVLIAPNTDVTHAMEMYKALFELPPKAIAGLSHRLENHFGDGIWTMLRGDVLARGMQVPGLVFHDPEDPVVPFEGSTKLAEAWPAAELIEVPGVGHGTITRDPNVIERSVSWISDRERAAASR